MKKLLLKLGLFSIICAAIISFMLMRYGGYVDFFYNKFTTPKAVSMIFGDSRSFQGMQPHVMNTYLADKGYDLPVFNYSFTGAQAIAGPYYNESIMKKLDNSRSNGIFVISVTPDFITSSSSYDNGKGEFREAGQPPHNMKFVDVNPNFEYFYKNFNFFHFKSVFRKGAKTHKDGWLEESNLPKDNAVFEEWRQHQIDLFLKDREDFRISDFRVKSLDSLVKKLRKHGQVFFVRMPIGKEFRDLENKYYPNFDRIIDSLSSSNSIHYFNYTLQGETTYKTYDGHHIDKYGGKLFTQSLCDSILKVAAKN